MSSSTRSRPSLPSAVRPEKRLRQAQEALRQALENGASEEEIAELMAELREAIVLFEYEQMSHAEIAETVGATPKAVETRIYRAREKLRAALIFADSDEHRAEW